MKHRLFALIITLLLFLTACGGGSGQAVYSIPEISALPPEEQLTEIYEPGQEAEFVGALRPSADYGQLYPYVGKISPITYFAGENRLFGLADEQGRIALEPVLIRATKCTTTEGEPYWELVYEPEDRPDDLLWKQIAALDGNWASGKYLCSDIEYNQDRVIVRVGENKNAYNLSGQPLGDTLLATAIFTEGLAPVYDRDLNSIYYAMYYIDTAGQRTFAQGFSYADDFCGGLAKVGLEQGGNALIDKQGGFVVEPGRYTFISRFDGDYAMVRGQNGLQGLIDREGREIFSSVYRELYWLDEERTLLAGHLDWQIYILNPATGSTELLPSGQGFYGEGWYYSQDRACKNLSLYKGEITRSFSVAEEADWGNRLECHYLGGDLFALSYRYNLPLVLTTGEMINGDIDKERSRLDFYDAAGGRVVKSVPRYAFRGQKENGYYVINDLDMWGNGEQMLLDLHSLEPLFGQSFDDISYLGNGLYSVLKDDYAGLRQEDGSWLLRVNLSSEWLSADELSYHGVTIGATPADELSSIVGAPVAEEPNIPGAYDHTYFYNDAWYFAPYSLEGEPYIIRSITVTARTDYPSPRDIKVGDSFADVYNKFPHEREYTEDDSGYFWGNDIWTEASGYVTDFEGGIMLVTTTGGAGDPFLRMEFQTDIVTKIIISYGT